MTPGPQQGYQLCFRHTRHLHTDLKGYCDVIKEMVSTFETFEQQYSVLTADITSQISQLSNSGTSKLQLHLNLL